MRSKLSRLARVLFRALLLGAVALPSGAQSGTPSKFPIAPVTVDLGNSAVALNAWKFHPGDNPAWALPGYDDSGWTTVELRGDGHSHDPNYSSATFVPGWTARGFPTLTRFAWYRTRFQVNGNNSDLWLEMPPDIDDVYQVYANGKMIGAFGKFTARHVQTFAGRSNKFHLPPAATNGEVLLALRFYMDPDTPEWNPQAGGLHSSPAVGLASAITLMQIHNNNVTLHTFLSLLLLGIVLAMAALAALWIYLIDRKEQAYLWLALAFLTGAAAALTEFLGGVTVWVSLTQILLARDVAGIMFAPLFWLLFWAHWFRLRYLRLAVRAGWALTLLELCVFVCTRHYLLASWFPAAWTHPLFLAGVALRVAVAGLLLATIVGGIRQDPAEGWPALPAIVLLGIGLFATDLQLVGVRVEYFPLDIRVGLDTIAWLVLAVIVIGLVLRRFLKTQVQQQEMAREMEAARQVQQLLVPSQTPNVPGFDIESVYLPASEVGGDFFQVQPGEDGSLLVVVGDVSGKGLKAAMTVSTIVGALRNEPSRRPAEILAHLNRVLHGQIKGFVTCCVTLISADGAMTIANAGHLSPYRNGEEVAVEGGLPLGIVPDGAYEETHAQLAPGDRLTFVSDGVVEATNEKRELFGFERTQRISSHHAANIAETAKNFGQEDDITVVSFQFLGETQVCPA